MFVIVSRELSIDVVGNECCRGKLVFVVSDVFGHLVWQHIQQHDIKAAIGDVGAVALDKVLPFAQVSPNLSSGRAFGEAVQSP